MLEQRHIFHVCRWNSKQFSLSCSPSPPTVSTQIFHTYLFFFFSSHGRVGLTGGSLEFSETARDLWPGTLHSEWAKFTDDLIQCMCVSVCVQTFTEWVARCQATLCELTTPYWRWLRRELVRKKGLCLVSSAVNKRYWLGRELWVKSLTLLLPEGRCLLT